MTHFFKLLALIMMGALFFFYAFIQQRSITFTSWESKGPTGGDVINEITYEQRGSQKIWMMRQNHQGLRQPREEWDRIAIVLSKGQVSFFQLQPGNSNINEWHEISKKVDCLNCHTQGPRIIRPHPTKNNFNFIERSKLYWWNKLIRQQQKELPLQIHSTDHNFRLLMVKSCTRCHRDQGSMPPLTSKNSDSIVFMVENHLMPPRKPLGQKGQLELKKFLAGF